MLAIKGRAVELELISNSAGIETLQVVGESAVPIKSLMRGWFTVVLGAQLLVGLCANVLAYWGHRHKLPSPPWLPRALESGSLSIQYTAFLQQLSREGEPGDLAGVI
ncbi:hypothetical protein P7K49_012604 [Saguinus oedipus]|uniref:Uncharacterized protein n=1 Tax=Saguinus oedipus TaxID=9490 RepID=A0ABQ9VEY1_SAGOE|nr:hypothetical protein P7K49_012604 [Saguinus oedipus]